MSFRTATFGDICEFKYGKSLAADNRIAGEVVVYGANGPVGTHNLSLSDGPAVIIGRKGSVGEVHYCDGPIWAIDTTYFVDANSTDCDLKWLTYALRSSRIRQLNRAAAVPGLNRNDAYREPILVPSFEEQKRIAAILDKADQLRQKRRQAIALLDSLTQLIFLEMFGDPVSNPRGWETGLLGDVVAAVVDCPHSTPNWTSAGKIALRTSNLTKGGWNWADTRYVSDIEFSERSRRRNVRPGDIVLSREGTVGIAAIVEPDMEVCLGQRLVQITPDEKKAVSAYLLHHLLFDLDPKRIARVMVGATSQHINVKDLRNLKVMMPPIAQQLEFQSKCNRLKRESISARASDENMRLLFASLQYRAFSGQL